MAIAPTTPLAVAPQISLAIAGAPTRQCHRANGQVSRCCALAAAHQPGLVKAINNFDPTLTERLAGYAQACVSGEIKRFFRDKRWQLRVRRADQELLPQVRTAGADLSQELGRAPSDAEVARVLDVTVQELGCSQMHVSRLQAHALSHLRRRLLAD